MLHTNFVKKIKPNFLFNNAVFFFSKVIKLMRQCDDISQGGQATCEIVILRVRIAYWITKAKNTHSEYLIILLFH